MFELMCFSRTTMYLKIYITVMPPFKDWTLVFVCVNGFGLGIFST